jgi:hypothetical protein
MRYATEVRVEADRADRIEERPVVSIWRSLCVATLGLGLAGCAFIDQKVALTYMPTTVSGQGSGEVAVVAPDDLELPEKDTQGKQMLVIGSVKNTFGMKTADAVTDHSVSDWITGALRMELVNSGYQPVVVDEVRRSGKCIAFVIDRVRVDQDPGFWTVGAIGDVQLTFSLYDDGERVAEFVVESKGQGHRGVIGDAATKEAAIRVALQECMREAMTTINERFGDES